MVIEDLSRFGIGIRRSVVSSCFRVVGLRELAPEENAGNRHVYVDVLGPDGEDLRSTGVKVWYGWEGMRDEEQPPPVVVDKPEGEHGCNFPMFPDMRAWVEVMGWPSDSVYGLRTDYVREDDREGRGWGHRSFLVTFRKER